MDVTLIFQTRIFRSDCITPMSSGESFTYGEELYLAIFGNDLISSSSEYEIGSLIALYRGSTGVTGTFDVLSVSMIKCSLTNNSCAKGQVFITIPMIFFRDLKFSTIVVLKDPKRVLSEDGEVEPKRARIDIPGRFEIGQDYARLIDNDDGSFGYSLALSMRILIELLTMII